MRRYYFAALLAGLLGTGCGQAPSPAPPAPNPVPAPPAPPLQAVAVPAAAAADAPILVLDAGGHTAGVKKVLFTPDGQEILTVAKNNTVRVWDAATGETVRVLRLSIGEEAGTISSAALSHDGKQLAVARGGIKDEDSRIYVIVLASGQIEHVLKGHTEKVRALAYSPDGKWLASGSDDTTIRLWDAASGKSAQVLKGHPKHINSLAFSPDSRRLVSAGHGSLNRVFLWAIDGTNSAGTPLKGHKGQVACAAWSPNGKTIATAGFADHTICLRQADGTVHTTLSPGIVGIRALAFTADSSKLLVVGAPCALMDLDGTIRVKFTGHTKANPGKLGAGAWDGAVAPGDQLALTAGREADELFLWQTADGAVVHHLGGKGRSSWSVAWAPDGQTIAWGNTSAAGTDGRRPLERTFSLTELEIGRAPDARYRRAQRVLGALSLEDVDKGVAVKRGPETVAKLDRPARQCATLLPGDRAAVGGAGLVLFDTRNGQLLRTFKKAASVHDVAPSPDGRYLLTAANTQALRIYDPDREEPLLSLFVAGDDWVAWTSEGYYACSPGGERLMGWHVNNGPDKLATFHPAAQFRASLYRPDVIKLVLKTGSVARAQEVADKARGQATALTDVAEVLPPTVVITAPDQAAVSVAEPTLEVRALAQTAGKYPITALRLLLNGRPHGGEAGLKKIAKPGAGPVRETWQITLTPGTHQLAVQAESAVSKGLSEPVQVTLEASRGLKKVPQTPQQQRADLPTLYVLAVGISDYPGDLKLRCAHRDAEVLAKTVGTHAKDLYRQVKVDVLTNKDATRRNILKKLSELGKAMTQRDVAVLSFAGHGERDARGRFFLLPVDADPADLLSSCVDGEQVKSVLADLPGRIILLLDACHSGAVGRERTRARGALTDDLVRDLASDDYGVVVMCSAMGREFALESEKVGHGFFTLALVEGLSGKAANKDGVVYLNQLDTYVTDRVRELSQGRQHPVTTRPTSIRSFPLAGASRAP
jgi:WD40 repeat protein